MLQQIGLGEVGAQVALAKLAPVIVLAQADAPEPVAQPDLATAGAPAHLVHLRLLAQHGGVDIHRHAGRKQPGAQADLGSLGLGGVEQLAVHHLGGAQHPLQHEDEVRQHLTAEAALRAASQPGACAALPGAGPVGKAQGQLHRLQLAHGMAGGRTEAGLQLGQAAAGRQREVDSRPVMALALQLQRAGRGRGIDRQGLFAEHRQAQREGALGPVQVRGRRAGDVDTAQSRLGQQLLGLFGHQQLRMPGAQGGPSLRVRVPGA
nr:hypothetical protein [Mitsuaria sp. WAJ17]